MITLRYETDEGQVEANFNSIDELYKFRDELKNREINRLEEKAKAEEEMNLKREEQIKKQEEEKKLKFNELVEETKVIFRKARDIGFSPEEVIGILSVAVENLLASN